MGFLKKLLDKISEEREPYDFDKDMTKMYKEKENLNYIRMIYSTNILGVNGINKNTSLILFDDRIRINAYPKNKDILFKDIKSIEIMNSVQIEEKSKVGQMMVIGLFALATKKKTEEVMKNKLVINVCEEGINYSIVADTVYDTIEEAKKLNKIISEYKNSEE